MTLSWPRLTWPAWDARQAGPRWRKMSATSTAGRDNGRASAGHLPQKVERAGHLADRADGDAGVERRRVEFLMSQYANFGVSDRRFRFKPAGGFGGNRQAVSVQIGTPLRMGFGPDFGEPPLRDTSYLALVCQSKYSCHYYRF